MTQTFTALVIDDDAFTCETTALALRKLGATEVHRAANGAEALALLGWRAFVDVIICDLAMPEVDGIETLRRLAGHHRQARIIVASGADPRVLRAARDVASDFGLPAVQILAKPVTVANLREAIGTSQPKRALPPAAIDLPLTIPDLERALAGAEFIAHYQPIVSFADGRQIGAEALARWRHPVHGLVPPAAFLPLARQHGKLDELTDLMLRSAIADGADWERRGLAAAVSVNLPLESLLCRDLPTRIDEIVAAHGLRPGQLTLEITEDGWLEPAAVAREVLARLRIHGYGLAIDDFGTEYATNQQLLNAPFDQLKIDGSFVRMAIGDDESRVILALSIDMAHELGLQVVAEGVETQAQWDLLAGLGCDAAQGFLIARPMPAEALPAWKASWDAVHAVGRPPETAARMAPEQGSDGHGRDRDLDRRRHQPRVGACDLPGSGWHLGDGADRGRGDA